MSKFTKATKRIAAVAASAVMVSSAAFGAGLSSYPSNFVSNGKFDGKVVVGAAASAMDTTSATSIIEDLKGEFSGSEGKVKITYKSKSQGGEELSAIRSNQALNYGEDLGTVTETAGFTDGDVDVLEDGRFSNGASDEDYEQTLKLDPANAMEFNYALRDNVDGVSKIMDGIYLQDGTVFATYKIEMKTAIDASTATSDPEQDFIGEKLSIMGNDFTIGDVSISGDTFSKIVLLGGANKVSLGEGESTSVTIEGKTYEVSVQSVSDSKVLLTINGETKSISEFDSEDIAGISVAVTDLVSSSRDAVKGYAEVVIGGQKITIENGKEVKVNEEDISDIYEDYEVNAAIDSSGADWAGFTLTYSVGDDTLLEKGDMLEDVLFQAFSLNYDGTNEPEYTTLKLSVNDDDVTVESVTEDGEKFNRDLVHMGAKTNANSAVWIKGENDEDRIFVEGSIDITAGAEAGSLDADLLPGTLPVFDLATTVSKGSGFLLEKDENEQYLYLVSSVDTTGVDHEVDFDEVLRGDDESDIKLSEWNTKLGVVGTVGTAGATDFTLDTVTATPLGSTIAFENEVLMDLSLVESDDIAVASSSTLVFTLDDNDTNADGSEDTDSEVTVTLTRDAADNEFNLAPAFTGAAAQTNAGDDDNEKGDSDVKTLANAYGILVEYDNDEDTYVKLMVPEEQVEAKVSLVFGGTGASAMTVTVNADMADDKKAELEDDGMVIVSSEAVSSTAVTFDVTAPVYDSDVTSTEDLIVVGGPAVNTVAASLLGLSYPTYGAASGVGMDEAVIRYFADKNSVVVYGYEGKDTSAAAKKLNVGGLSGEVVNVQQ